MKNEILRLRGSGKTYDEITKTLGCAKSTVAYHCSSDIKKASQISRLRNKRKCVIELKRKFGGCCSICGYKKCLTSLEFHHPDPLVKNGSVAVILCVKGKKAAFEEAKKCILVCSNCHGELEEKIRGTYNNLVVD